MKIKHFLILLMSLIGISARAVTFDYTYEGSTLTYEITSVSKCKIAGNKSVADTVSIPAKAQYNGRLYDVSEIDKSAFSQCRDLTCVIIPNSVTSIGDYAFYSCYGLNSVTIPNSVTSIGDYAFSQSSLTSVTIPNSVISIGESAFNYTQLTSVTIQSTVVSINGNPFMACANLKSIIVDADNQNYCSVEGVLFNKSRDTLLVYPEGKSSTYDIPNSVTSIGDYAFAISKSLTSVTIPNSVTSIGKGAFYFCSGLESVTIPNSITSIGDYAFYGCNKLIEIYCSAVMPPVCANSSFDSVPTACKVYVPKNSVAAYCNATGWDRLTNIIGYYMPGGDNESLYIQNFFIEPGMEAYMPVCLRAERDYSDFTTDVYLPKGLEIVTNEEGFIDVQYACVEDDAHLIFADSQPDGAIRVWVMSFGNAPMTGNGSEELFRLPVRATSSLASEPVPVWMRNTLFKDANYGYLFNDANPNINIGYTTGCTEVKVAPEAVYYNLQGVRTAQPGRGQIYICVQGGKTRKIVL